MEPEIFELPSSRNGETLHCVRWMPDGEPRASLQIVHGMTEHILRYDGFASYLTSRGFAVYGHDHLGHGGTSREKGFIAEEGGDELLVRDTAEVNARMRRDLPGIPHLIMGHSMGSFVVRVFLTRHGGDVDGAVVMGTGQQPGYQTSVALAVAKVLCMAKGRHSTSGMLNDMVFGAYSKGFSEPDLPNRWLSRDPAVLERYESDPDCGFPFTNAGYRDLFALIRRAVSGKDIGRIPKDLPVLLVSGAEDPVGGYGRGVERAREQLERQGLRPEMVLYPGMRHEVLNEIGCEKVRSDLADWMEKVAGI